MDRQAAATHNSYDCCPVPPRGRRPLLTCHMLIGICRADGRTDINTGVVWVVQCWSHIDSITPPNQARPQLGTLIESRPHFEETKWQAIIINALEKKPEKSQV